MPHRKKLCRHSIKGVPRFITFSCYRSFPLLANARIRDRFASDLARTAETAAVRLHAWVIMPNHVHLIAEPGVDQSISQFLHTLKSPFAFAVINRWREFDAPILVRLIDDDGGGYDRVVLVNSELEEKIRYIHLNPVRKGLCEAPEAWAWSSAAARP